MQERQWWAGHSVNLQGTRVFHACPVTVAPLESVASWLSAQTMQSHIVLDSRTLLTRGMTLAKPLASVRLPFSIDNVAVRQIMQAKGFHSACGIARLPGCELSQLWLWWLL